MDAASQQTNTKGPAGARPRSELDSRNERSETDQEQTSQPGAVEWIFAAVSAVLVLAMLGLLLYEALDQDVAFADFQAEQLQTERVGSRYLVRFRVTNRGDVTAATVLVEGTLKRGDASVETSVATFDYLPSRSEQRGGLLFSNDPAEYMLSLEAKGYSDP